MRALADPELSDADRAIVAITIMFPDADKITPEYQQDAVNKAIWFIGCGKPEKNTEKRKPLRLVDWDRDFPLMVSPINRIIGKEVRAIEYMHWWTFMAAWDEIPPDCLFAQVVKIRRKKAMGDDEDSDEDNPYKGKGMVMTGASINGNYAPVLLTNGVDISELTGASASGVSTLSLDGEAEADTPYARLMTILKKFKEKWEARRNVSVGNTD